MALGHHRHRWPHAVAFVQPTGGGAARFLSTGLGKPLLEALPAGFARRTGAGQARHILPVLANAGRHGPEGLTVPEGVTPVFPPPYGPELRPAERPWPLVDGPVADRRFATLADLDATAAERRRRLDPASIRPHTRFHRRPKPISPDRSPGDGMTPAAWSR